MTPAEIFARFGRELVLLKLRAGEKAPIDQGWQRLTLADMTPEYLRSLNGNIGVKLGPDAGNLASIDIDVDGEGEQFLALNPRIADTVISNGARGCNVWLEVGGKMPSRTHKIKTKDGQPWGEWRWAGGQTVISGTHPSGVQYSVKGGPVLKIDFEDIVWPDYLELPWIPKPAAAAAGFTEADLVAKCGPFFWTDQNGTITKVNESYIAQRFCLENLVIYEQVEGGYFIYDKTTGAWTSEIDDVVKKMVLEAWEKLVVLFGRPDLHRKGGNAMFGSLTNLVRALCGRTKVFKRLKRILHCKNGMLHLEDQPHLMPFSEEYFARNPIPINYNPEAKCPKFLAFLNKVLGPDDVSLLIRWFGSVLLTGNIAQRVLLLVGAAHSGKSTVAEVVEYILGRVNVTALRTDMLHERFEIGRLFGYTLLTAKDVEGTFLEEKGADVLKRLVGHDYTPGERKHGMKHVEVYGDYDCLITCNKRMAVILDGDVEAWRRRLMIIYFPTAIPPNERIGDFAELLCEEEGEGILALAVAGAYAHMEELASPGANFRTTPEQDDRVNRLLEESESIMHFVINCVVRVDGGDGLSTAELVGAYTQHCIDRDWRPRGVKEVEIQLVDLMMTVHGVHCAGNIQRTNGRVRGYPNVKFKKDL
jgi:P4 family phage/plasmid primase-like protien